jgi:hypothetical protein
VLAAGGLALRAHAHGSHAGVIRGALIYQARCASCHGASGHGDGRRAADGLSRPVDLTALAARDGGFDRSAVAARIDGAERPTAHGESETPVWGDPGLRVLAGQPLPPRLEELLDYLEHLQGRGRGSTNQRTAP